MSSTVTVTDVTTKAVLFSEPDAKGIGQGNHNQNATTCSGTDAEVPASTFFGERGLDLPEGVSHKDIIRAFTESQVVSMALTVPQDSRALRFIALSYYTSGGPCLGQRAAQALGRGPGWQGLRPGS